MEVFLSGTDYYWENWYEICLDWYTENEWGLHTQALPVKALTFEYEYLYTECVWWEDPRSFGYAQKFAVASADLQISASRIEHMEAYPEERGKQESYN
jgi:hypothetical protein